uniref:Uncharacterized protein n=1 Tax=Physcomitrium patens TaxID=3218 RepID=A0A2K1JHX3_PHYPA|nr:hypothetical protein PHYPA_018560 [Physcomitrium patens]
MLCPARAPRYQVVAAGGFAFFLVWTSFGNCGAVKDRGGRRDFLRLFGFLPLTTDLDLELLIVGGGAIGIFGADGELCLVGSGRYLRQIAAAFCTSFLYFFGLFCV